MRLSIRFKVLALVASILAGAMVSYLLLASRLFTRDKLAYIYDLDSSLARTLAEEVRSGLETLADKVMYYASEELGRSAPGGEPHASSASPTTRLFRSEPDLLEIAFYKRDAGDRFLRVRTIVDDARLGNANVTKADLGEASQRYPIDFASALQLERLLDNISLPPDLGLWRLCLRLSDDVVISAILKPERFLRMFGDTEAYSAYLVDARGGVLLHPVAKKVVEHENLRGFSIVREALESKAPRAAQSFTGEQARTFIGAYARVASFGVAVITETPESEANRASAELVRKSTLFGVGIVLVAFLISIFFSRRISSPLQRLTAAMRDVGGGNFTVNVPIESGDEVGVLAGAFNRMARELDDRDRRIEQSREDLLRAEKLAALGVLGAEITHEIKNPLTAIVGFAQLGKASQNVDELREYMLAVENQTKRARDLLENFLNFTRQEQTKHAAIDLNEVVRDALKLVRHQLAKHQVEVKTQLLAEPALVQGDHNQLQQVLLNLILNADQAMDGDRGVLLISTERPRQDRVSLCVKDSGSGMSDDVKKQLFKPFFTTKPRGKGTGLGLSVSFNIVQQHAGEISVESAPGKGTTFTVTLPTPEAQRASVEPRVSLG